MSNTLNYVEAQASLEKLKKLAETVRSSLNGMNALIQDNVNSGAGIWDGTSAAAFTMKWNDISNEIPTYCMYLENQINNLSTFIKKTAASDETLLK